MVHTPLTNIRRTYGYPEACYALAHPFYRPGQRYPARRAARCGRTRVVCRSERSLRHALDGRESAPRVLLGTRLLPLARRAYARYPLHRVRPPRHEPSAAIPARDALGVLAPALSERPHRSRFAPGGLTRGARGDVRCRHRRDREPSVMIPSYVWRCGVPRARGFFIGTNLWNVPLLLSESLRQGGDLRRGPRGGCGGPGDGVGNRSFS